MNAYAVVQAALRSPHDEQKIDGEHSDEHFLRAVVLTQTDRDIAVDPASVGTRSHPPLDPVRSNAGTPRQTGRSQAARTKSSTTIVKPDTPAKRAARESFAGASGFNGSAISCGRPQTRPPTSPRPENHHVSAAKLLAQKKLKQTTKKQPKQRP